MGARTESRKIGETEYTVTQMPPSQSVPLQIELMAVALPVLGPLLKQANGSESAMADALNALGTTLATSMPGDKFLKLAQRLVCNDLVRTENGPVIFEQQFIGDDGMDLYLLIGFVLEVNYAKFFTASGLGRLGQMAKASLAKAN